MKPTSVEFVGEPRIIIRSIVNAEEAAKQIERVLRRSSPPQCETPENE